MAGATQRGDRLGREYWRGLVVRFESSPLGQAEFAEWHGVNLGTFRYWLYRLRGEAGETGLGLVPASFVEVVAGGGAIGDEMACSIRVGAAELRFARSPSAAYLAELLVRVGT